MNGNKLTHWMHLIVWNELHKMRVNQELSIHSIIPEKTVLLSPSNSNGNYSNGNGHYTGNHFFHDHVKMGSFDFLVETPNKKIGFEVLSRPSKHKMQRKLMYLDKVDEFVFVIPSNSFEFFRKGKSKSFYFSLRKKFFPKEFKKQNLKVWLLNLNTLEIEEKNGFEQLFNVKS